MPYLGIMSETYSILWIMLGTFALALFAALVGAVIFTLLDIRRTVRTIDETVQRLAPDLEATLANARQVSEGAVEATESVSNVGKELGQTLTTIRSAAGPVQQAAGRVMPVLAGITGLLAAWRTIKSVRGPASKKGRGGRQ